MFDLRWKNKLIYTQLSLRCDCENKVVNKIINRVDLGSEPVLDLLVVQVGTGFEDLSRWSLRIDLLHVVVVSTILAIEIHLNYLIKKVTMLLLGAYPPNQIPLGEIEIAAVRPFTIWREEDHLDD